MQPGKVIAALAALAHEHRLAVYRLLVEAGPAGLNAGTIARRLNLPASSLTFHVQQLHRADLITQERRSRELIYAADFTVMNGLLGFLTENCCAGSGSCETDCAPPRGLRKPRRKPAKAA